jgi:two-component system sensor histidine kinase DegS
MSFLAKAIRRPGTWLLILLLLGITLLQYAYLLKHPTFLADLTANLGLTRYTVERVLYLLPIILASLLFGWRGGVTVTLIAVGCMLPRDILNAPHRVDDLVETSIIFIIGILVSYSLESLRKERERRAQLETAQKELQVQLHVIEENEKRLAALNRTSSIISQTLELDRVFDSAVDCVRDVTGVDAVRIYVTDNATQELSLAAYRGISEEFAAGASKMKIGEGLNGRVAETGEPLFVKDVSEEDRPLRLLAEKEGIRSELIVPLVSKGKVVGTLCVAMHRERTFLPEDVDMLTAIGNQIGVAIENAQLYLQERKVAEQLRVSEQRYRELFENAHDAIWLHDLEGNIVAANRACVRLTGYSLEELCNLKATRLLSENSLDTARDIQSRLIKGDDVGYFGEVKLVKKDGTEAFVQIASSLVYSNNTPAVFQHLARDITDARNMQENLRFLLQQITRVQEEERKRIARELHDETIQTLVALCLRIDDLASSAKVPQELRLGLEELYQQANNIMMEVRRLSQDLRPAALDSLGLVPALEGLASQITKYSGIVTEVNVAGEKRRLPDEVELVLFRIVQEVLRNVWKHAEATEANITLEFAEGSIRAIFRDNGKGFEPPKVLSNLPRYGKLGLAGIQERVQLLGGTLAISSELGKGTTITAKLPF